MYRCKKSPHCGELLGVALRASAEDYVGCHALQGSGDVYLHDPTAGTLAFDDAGGPGDQ